MFVDQALAFGDQARQVLQDDRLEQLFLARVVEVQRALGDAGGARHLFRARGGEALLDEQRQRGVEQFLRPRFLAALAQRRCGFGRFGVGAGLGDARAHVND